MFRMSALLLALAGLLFCQAVALTQTGGDTGKTDAEKKAEEIKKWTGFWQVKQPNDRKEYWKISEKDGKWAVEGAIVDKNNMPLGIFFSNADDTKWENGTFTFSRDWFKKPNDNYQDKEKVTAILNGDGLQFSAKEGHANAQSFVMSKMSQAPVIGPQATDLIGSWKTHVDGLDEVVIIKPAGNALAISTVYYKNGVVWGLAVGGNPQYDPSTGQLQYAHVYQKKPYNNWQNCIVTLTPKGNGKMDFAWQIPNGGSGTRHLTLIPGTGFASAKNPDPDPIKKNPDDPKPTPGDTTAFVGTFSGEVDGIKEVWALSNENGQWAVKGLFFKNDAQVGMFVGNDVQMRDGKLTFTQKLTERPAGVSWIDNASVTVSLAANGNLSYVWQVGTVTGTPRILTKGR